MRRFFDSKTSCFGIVEGLSFIIKCHTFHTKTSCFGVVMLSDTFLRTTTLTNKMTLNMLEAKVTLSSKKYWKKFPPEWLQEEVIIHLTSGGNFITLHRFSCLFICLIHFYFLTFSLSEKIGCISKMKINRNLFCTLLDFHYLCNQVLADGRKRPKYNLFPECRVAV